MYIVLSGKMWIKISGLTILKHFISSIDRFMYHFTVARQTNRLDKPEWFFTQILNWARDNHIFVGTNIQPALNLAGHSDVNIRVKLFELLIYISLNI